MTTPAPARRHPIAGIATILVICLALGMTSCTQQRPLMTIRDAYQLRMTGHADSALVGLQTLIAADSANAEAWYELARTEHQLGLGSPQELFDRLGKAERAIDTAVRLAPPGVIYSFYEAYVRCTLAYSSLMRSETDAADRVKSAVAALESVVSLKPDYIEPMLFLVEFLSLPSELGGDSAKADAYAQKLEALDGVIGAKARELLLPDDVDRLEFWRGVLAEHDGNPDVLEQLGKAHLYRDDIEQGTIHLEAALKADPTRQRLVLDLARYHMMRARGDEGSRDEALRAAEGLLQRFLETGPIPPLQAYALGLRALVASGAGNSAGFEQFRQQAATVDPHYSKAFGAPPPVLFAAPDELPRFHAHFFRPL